MSIARKKRRPPTTERASGFGSAAHIVAYRDGFFGRAIVALRSGQDAADVRADLLGECRLHLYTAQVLRGLPSAVADVLAEAAEDAIARAVKDYKPAGPAFSRGAVRKIRLQTDGDGMLQPVWGEEEREALRRFEASGAEAGIDPELAVVIGLRALEDPSGYEAAIAAGLTRAEYLRREVRRRDEEDRDRCGPGSYFAGLDRLAREGGRAPSPDHNRAIALSYEAHSLTLEAAMVAIEGFEAANAWVLEEEAAASSRGTIPGRVERARAELGAATGRLCEAIRSQYAGRGAAVSVDWETYVDASESPDRPRIIKVVEGRTHATYSPEVNAWFASCRKPDRRAPRLAGTP
jgi:hypothetical protein